MQIDEHPGHAGGVFETLKRKPSGKKPTVSQLKEANPDSHFFDRASMKFFGQTMKSFSVEWHAERGVWVTVAAMYGGSGNDRRYMGESRHMWNADTLKHIGALPKE